MTRSTIQPDSLRLWEVEQTNREFLLHISANWNATEAQIEDDQGTHTEWQYDSIRFVVPYDGKRDGVAAFLDRNEGRLILVAKTLWEVRYDKAALTADEIGLLKDRDTQEAIRSALHPVAGSGEEIKILREQIKAIATHVRATLSVDFINWDGITASKIKEKK